MEKEEKIQEPKKIKEYLLIGLALSPAILLFIWFVWFHYSTFKAQNDLEAIEERGIEAGALLLKSTESSSHRSMETYSFVYEYTVDGRKYEKDKYVDGSKYVIYDEGSSIPIKYLPEDPSISDIPGNFGLENQWIQLIVLDLFLLIAVLIGIFNYRRKQRKKIKNPDILDEEI